jgi:hypothetical protein
MIAATAYLPVTLKLCWLVFSALVLITLSSSSSFQTQKAVDELVYGPLGGLSLAEEEAQLCAAVRLESEKSWCRLKLRQLEGRRRDLEIQSMAASATACSVDSFIDVMRLAAAASTIRSEIVQAKLIDPALVAKLLAMPPLPAPELCGF